MAGVSGQYGTVKTGTAPGTTVVAEVNKWSINKAVQLFDVASAETPSGGDGFQHVRGRKNHTGSMSGLYDPAHAPTFAEGDVLVANFYVSATQYYSCSIIIESLGFDVDIEGGSPMVWTAPFKVNGLLGSLLTLP